MHLHVFPILRDTDLTKKLLLFYLFHCSEQRHLRYMCKLNYRALKRKNYRVPNFHFSVITHPAPPRPEEMGLTWWEAQVKAQYRTRWRQLIAALCPTGDEED